MTVQDLLSGAWGTGGAAIIGAIVIIFVKRMIAGNDKTNDKRDAAIEELKTAINNLNTNMAVMSIEIKNLGEKITFMDKHGCSWGRRNYPIDDD